MSVIVYSLTFICLPLVAIVAIHRMLKTPREKRDDTHEK